jgi:hypothetical protein
MQTGGPGGTARFVCRWSGPVSRILSRTTICLGPPSPATSSGHTRALAGPALTAPICPCSGWGLPSRHVAVTLVRSYRTVSAFLPAVLRPAGESSFLWHFPSARAALPLAGTLPCGVRTFLTHVPERARARPSSPLRGDSSRREAAQHRSGSSLVTRVTLRARTALAGAALGYIGDCVPTCPELARAVGGTHEREEILICHRTRKARFPEAAL